MNFVTLSACERLKKVHRDIHILSNTYYNINNILMSYEVGYTFVTNLFLTYFLHFFLLKQIIYIT